jgi:hypothetical protein
LHSYDFSIKHPINKIMKIMKTRKHLRFLSNKTNLGEFAEIINKTYIIILSSNRGGCWTPYIRKHKI